jgi:hypothetical protein
MHAQHLYPELGVDLGERAYGADCRLYIPGRGVNWPVIRDTLFDEFVIAHTLGWWGKVRGGVPLAHLPPVKTPCAVLSCRLCRSVIRRSACSVAWLLLRTARKR